MPKVKFVPNLNKDSSTNIKSGSLWLDESTGGIYMFSVIVIPLETPREECIGSSRLNQTQYALVSLSTGFTYDGTHKLPQDAVEGFKLISPCKIKVIEL